ncbi:MAG TPA: thioredoxin-disulfide reductase [Treponemataceae bacterium]|nr:thioredoxin-disulfide reductase [Treponemataceae bacterium]
MGTIYDMIIIGGGPAGLSAAQYAGRSNLKTLVIEEKGEGGQAVLIDRLENYPGILEPVNGYEFASNMKEQAVRFGAEFTYGKVTGLGKKGAYFNIPIESPDAEPVAFESRTVLLATGAEHRKLGVPGENEYYGKGVSYCATCDGPFFRNKHIVVVGGGDAACDEAGFLAHLTDRVTMVHRKGQFRAQKALAERTLHNPHINVRFNTAVSDIKGSGGSPDKVTGVVLKNAETGEEETLACDAVFIFVGMIPRTELASLAKQDENGYLVTDEHMQTSIRGLFAAGDLRAKPFRQVVTAVADGAIAAHSASACIDEQRCGLGS